MGLIWSQVWLDEVLYVEQTKFYSEQGGNETSLESFFPTVGIERTKG